MEDLKTLKWIFKKTKSQVLNFVLLNLLNVIYSVLSIYLILISKNTIDAAVSQSILSLKKYIIELIVVSFIEIALKAIIGSIDAVTRAKLEISFKQDVLNTILKKDYAEITKFHSGELMTRITSDVNIIIETLVSLIPSILSMITKLICAVILLFQISQEFVTIFLVAGIILFIFINLFKPYIKCIHKKVQEATSNVRLFLKELFENLMIIKIFDSEEEIANKSMQLLDERYQIQMKQKSMSIASVAGFNTVFQVGYLYALIWSSYNLYMKNITVGGLTSIVQLISQVQMPIIGLSKSFQNTFMMIASAERIIELEKIAEEKKEESIDKNILYENLTSIVLKNVKFTYESKEILKDVNLQVNKGEIIAIYGESGVGKSTLLKLILGIIKCDSGEIYFDLNHKDKQMINRSSSNMFAYVPQGQFILSDTIRENLTFVNRNVSDKTINEALEASQCKEFVEHLENGLDTKIGERGVGLSEGQLQRLSIARALISEAPILILDEITSSLDPKTEKEVLNNIKNLKNKTCIIVTHRDSISQICDREFIVKNKKIEEKVKNGRN